jgi:hypothetical protein
LQTQNLEWIRKIGPGIGAVRCNNIAVRNTLSVDISIRTDLLQPDQDVISSSAQEAVVAAFSGAPFWRDSSASPLPFHAPKPPSLICKAPPEPEP